jgi:hypothetical protein
LVESASPTPGWIYIQSRNDMLRRVSVSAAKVFYAEEIPENQRRVQPSRCLRAGAEVRVMAEQDEHGDWRAQQIEILRLPPTH